MDWKSGIRRDEWRGGGVRFGVGRRIVSILFIICQYELRARR